MRQRRFAGTVRPHDGVHFALVHGERKPVENLAILDTNLEIFDFEQWHHILPFFPRPEERQRRVSKDGADTNSLSHPSRRPLRGLLRMRRYPTLPSSEIDISFCASTANSIGSCCGQSFRNPLTSRPTSPSCATPRST